MNSYNLDLLSSLLAELNTNVINYAIEGILLRNLFVEKYTSNTQQPEAPSHLHLAARTGNKKRIQEFFLNVFYVRYLKRKWSE